jgi:hypothetical protein
VNQAQNVRTVFIQVDDICELALKSYLQMNVNNWDPTGGTRSDGRPWYKGFRTVVGEVRNQVPNNQQLSDLLDRFIDRREDRNHFFHDHNLSGLTVTPQKCLEALCDLYDLLEILFSEFADIVRGNNILRVQVAVIKLKHRTWQGDISDHQYQTILQQWRHSEGTTYLPASSVLLLRHPCLGYEFCVIYRDPRGLYEALDDAGLIL